MVLHLLNANRDEKLYKKFVLHVFVSRDLIDMCIKTMLDILAWRLKAISSFFFPSEAHATGQRPVARSERSERSVGEALLHFIGLKKISHISTTSKKYISLIDFFDLLCKVHIKKIFPQIGVPTCRSTFFSFLKTYHYKVNFIVKLGARHF